MFSKLISILLLNKAWLLHSDLDLVYMNNQICTSLPIVLPLISFLRIARRAQIVHPTEHHMVKA